ncbi:hypothetical protein Pcinc_033507 [Petrolisthes cinctipes]|uniref:Uncharacterized protein n=1 Tax=Petrolisthes cinctipes TaxID=88211 RepID=A0AAE1ESA9_PETCI|nr:hypothetical protein Pcinc_033507 [Petrolisthes cinctipes]
MEKEIVGSRIMNEAYKGWKREEIGDVKEGEEGGEKVEGRGWWNGDKIPRASHWTRIPIASPDSHFKENILVQRLN